MIMQDLRYFVFSITTHSIIKIFPAPTFGGLGGGGFKLPFTDNMLNTMIGYKGFCFTAGYLVW